MSKKKELRYCSMCDAKLLISREYISHICDNCSGKAYEKKKDPFENTDTDEMDASFDDRLRQGFDFLNQRNVY